MGKNYFSRGGYAPLPLDPPGNFFSLKILSRVSSIRKYMILLKKIILKKWGAMPPYEPPLWGEGVPPPGKKCLPMTLSSIWAFRIYIVLSWYIYTDRVYWGQRSSRKWGAEPPLGQIFSIFFWLIRHTNSCWFRIYIVLGAHIDTQWAILKNQKRTDTHTHRLLFI